MATPAAPPEPAAAANPAAGAARAPAAAPAAVPVKRHALGGNAFASFTARVLLVIAGVGFVAGFFFPWLKIGGAAASGLGLLVMQGDAVEFVSWPQRILMFAVPLLGSALLVTGFIGHRIALWLGLAAGIVVIGGGTYTLIRLFFGATGTGMWIVVGSALLALSVALLSLGRASRR